MQFFSLSSGISVTCGISKRVACTRLIDNKGFNSLKYFGVIGGDMDVLEREKRLASTAFVTRVNLGTVQIKRLQALVWWIHDNQTHNQPLIAAKFGQVAKRVEMTGKQVEKKRAETDENVSGLGKSNEEEFKASNDGFYNLLSQKMGTTKADIRYVIRDRVVMKVLPDVATERMYQIRISGEAFGEDNSTLL